MGKQLCLATAIIISQVAFSQKAIDDMIKAEMNFAAFAVNNNMKDAFLKFADSNAIMFSKGKKVNAIEYWKQQDQRPGILNWHPDYAEISISGDFGFTSGPWTFQTTSLKDTPVASGHFATVWQLNKNGEWKFMADFGIDHSLLPLTSATKKIYSNKKNSLKNSEKLLVQYEEDFNRYFSLYGAKAYKKFMAENSRLNVNGFVPATDEKSRKNLVGLVPEDLKYVTNGIHINNANDMGFSYGTVTNKDKTENYLRFWRKEKDEWKIALEVLRY